MAFTQQFSDVYSTQHVPSMCPTVSSVVHSTKCLSSHLSCIAEEKNGGETIRVIWSVALKTRMRRSRRTHDAIESKALKSMDAYKLKRKRRESIFPFSHKNHNLFSFMVAYVATASKQKLCSSKITKKHETEPPFLALKIKIDKTRRKVGWTLKFGGEVCVIEMVLSAAQVLASWKSSASLVFHSLLMRIVSAESVAFRVLTCATRRIPLLGLTPICLRFGADICGWYPRMLSC
ncbi:unnamed protein product [Sphenostylis stenocarpa]|uniref:Uncharacterized protein n=1 Tax=Sphenostylis stenocarpa TaxID=92480 RepID=A0AA86VCS8_9FABA|nr:unnamed protein product [Sphenostylis stenocarpa]